MTSSYQLVLEVSVRVFSKRLKYGVLPSCVQVPSIRSEILLYFSSKVFISLTLFFLQVGNHMEALEEL